MGLFSAFFYNDIPVMYHEYHLDKHDILQVYHYKKRYGTNPFIFYLVYTIHMDEDTICL